MAEVGATGTPGGDTPGGDERTDASMSEAERRLETTRARSGLAAVIIGDVAIVVAAVVGLIIVHGSRDSDAIVSILTSAFTAIGTLSTAYFGIKAVANTAKTAVSAKN